MTINTIVTIVLIIATLVAFGMLAYFYIRDKTLDEIRSDVYQKFLEVEHNPEFAQKGKQKMKWVLSQARSLLPAWTQPFISDVFLEKVVDKWFKAIKDLLDDGKLNKSQK